MSRNNHRSNQGNQGGNSSANHSGNNSGAGRKRRKSRKKPKLDPVSYWGDASSLPVRNDYALQSNDPTAVIRSLGKAPIPGKNSAPELYFEVLYNRAAGLAQALAFAGGLNQDTSPAAETAKDVPRDRAE